MVLHRPARIVIGTAAVLGALLWYALSVRSAPPAAPLVRGDGELPRVLPRSERKDPVAVSRRRVPPVAASPEHGWPEEKDLPRIEQIERIGSSGALASAAGSSVPPTTPLGSPKPMEHVSLSAKGDVSPAFLEMARELDGVVKAEDRLGLRIERLLARTEDLDRAVEIMRGELAQAVSLDRAESLSVTAFVRSYHPRLRAAWRRATALAGQRKCAPWDGGAAYDNHLHTDRFRCDIDQRRRFSEAAAGLRKDYDRFLDGLFDASKKKLWKRYQTDEAAATAFNI